MVCVHQGTERSLALSPHAAAGIPAPGQLLGSGRRWDPGTSHPPGSLLPPPSPPGCSQQGVWLGEEGALDRARCGENRNSPPARLLGCRAARAPAWHRTRPPSPPWPWEHWVTGKHFFFNHYFWRYSDPRIEFMRKIGLLSQGT